MHVLPAKHSYACYQESMTTKVWLPDKQTPDKVIPMCRYALKATQYWLLLNASVNLEFVNKLILILFTQLDPYDAICLYGRTPEELQIYLEVVWIVTYLLWEVEMASPVSSEFPVLFRLPPSDLGWHLSSSLLPNNKNSNVNLIGPTRCALFYSLWLQHSPCQFNCKLSKECICH